MNRNHHIFGAFFLCVILLFSGCRKESGPANWHVDALLPLVHSQLSIGNIIPDSLIAFDENELIYLSFADTILRFKLDTLIHLPDTSIEESFIWPVGLEVQPGTQLSNLSDEIELQSNDIELRRATISEGVIHLNLVSTFPGAILANYQIPDATLNGVPLQVSALVPAGSNQAPANVELSLDVAGYDLDFSNGSEPFNRLPTQLTLAADPNGPTIQLSPGNSFTLTTSFNGLKPGYAEGYFGQQSTETGSESQAIDAFNIIESGTIDLDAVNVNLRIINAVGVDIRATINEFNAVNTNTGSNISLNHSIESSPINLNRATHSSGIITPSVYDIVLNNGNSDIDLMLESLPNGFVLDADLELNPLGNVSNHHDFAYAKSSIAGILEVNIPLCLIANQLQISDTADFSLGENGNLNNIVSGTLNIQLNNGYPLEGWLGLIALIPHEENLVLLNEGYFPAGITDSGNIVLSPVSQHIAIDVNEESMDRLKRAEQLVIRARFSTSSLTEHVKLFKYYKLDVKIIADFTYHVNN